MDYTRHYKEAKHIVEGIRSGQYRRTPKAQEVVPTGGFMSRDVKTEPQEYSLAELLIDEMSAMDKVLEERSTTGAMTMVSADLEAAREALAAVESRGSGDYAALGPVMESGMYAGQRAYGRYQVMEGNIPSWTKKALGYEMSPQEFLENKAAQDAVVEWKLQREYDKHGSWEDAASVWFTGGPLSKNANKSDGNLTANEYVQRFQKELTQ